MTAHQCCWELLARRAELSDAEEARVRAHLRDCPPCQRVAAAFARDALLLRALPLPDPPAEIRQAIRARLHQRPDPERT